MTCEFKVGDEVEHVGGLSDQAQIAFGMPPIIMPTRERGRVTELRLGDGYFRMQVSCRPFEPRGYDPRFWRRVQNRNHNLTLEAFSVIKDGGFEEPKIAPQKQKEKKDA